MRKQLICLAFLLFLSACAENYATDPVQGEAVCFQAFIQRPWNPIDQGINAWAFYNCNSKVVISTGAQNQSSLASILPSPSGVAQDLVTSPLK